MDNISAKKFEFPSTGSNENSYISLYKSIPRAGPILILGSLNICSAHRLNIRNISAIKFLSLSIGSKGTEQTQNVDIDTK
jgi:hypothetical protein